MGREISGAGWICLNYTVNAAARVNRIRGRAVPGPVIGERHYSTPQGSAAAPCSKSSGDTMLNSPRWRGFPVLGTGPRFGTRLSMDARHNGLTERLSGRD